MKYPKKKQFTLINIDEFSILELFVEKIIIPNEVYEEVSQYQSAKKYFDSQIGKGFIVLENYEDIGLFIE